MRVADSVSPVHVPSNPPFLSSLKASYYKEHSPEGFLQLHKYAPSSLGCAGWGWGWGATLG